MTMYHANGCGGLLMLTRKGPSPETSMWRCKDCDGYTNAVAETREEALAGGDGEFGIH